MHICCMYILGEYQAEILNYFFNNQTYIYIQLLQNNLLSLPDLPDWYDMYWVGITQ